MSEPTAPPPQAGQGSAAAPGVPTDQDLAALIASFSRDYYQEDAKCSFSAPGT